MSALDQLHIRAHLATGEVGISREHLLSGEYGDGLPPSLAHFLPRLTAWGAQLVDHYTEDADSVDLVAGWDSPDRADALLREARMLQKAMRLPDWEVEVSPEPGIAVVRLMGEYFCDWPLWVHDGGTGPEQWPMLSDGLRDRLTDWAIRAEPALDGDRPDHPTDEESARLALDIQNELGPRFEVRIHR